MATANKGKTTRKKKAETEEVEVEGEEVKPVKVKKPRAKSTTPRVRKAAAQPRVKLYWGVFNQNVKRVAVFEFDKKKEAEKHVKELSKAGTEHFMQKIKEVIE
jgi:hypothetical protein